MSGTNGSFIVSEVNQIDGYVQPIGIGGTINFVFNDLMSSVTMHNVTNDFIRVAVTTVPASLGNTFVIIAPMSAQSISNAPEAVIQSLDVIDLTLTGNGGGFIVANGFFR